MVQIFKNLIDPRKLTESNQPENQEVKSENQQSTRTDIRASIKGMLTNKTNSEKAPIIIRIMNHSSKVSTDPLASLKDKKEANAKLNAIHDILSKDDDLKRLVHNEIAKAR